MEMVKLADDDPRLLAFSQYLATPAYIAACQWPPSRRYRRGLMLQLFVTGWDAAKEDDTPAPAADDEAR